MALAGKEQFGNAAPGEAFLAQYQRSATQVEGQLAVGLAVANDITAAEVVFVVVHILAQHAGAGFAVGMVVLGEMAVDMDGVEVNALAVQGLKDEVVHGPERVFWKRRGAKAILVAHHHQLEIEMLADERQVVDDSLGEA